VTCTTAAADSASAFVPAAACAQMRTPYIVPTAAYLANLTSSKLFGPALIDVVDPATNKVKSIFNPLVSFRGLTRNSDWDEELTTMAASFSSQVASFVASPEWGCTWAAG
jgi:hypothetical protein